MARERSASRGSRLEIRLLRRLPASASSTARTNCSASPARSRSPISRGDRAPTSRAATTSRWSRARSPPPHDAERIRDVRRRSQHARDDRRLRHRGRHPGAAQLRRCAGDSPPSSTPGPSTSTRSRPRRRSPTTCAVDFELRGCPINKRQLLEVISALLVRAARPSTPPHSVCVECKLRGQRLRDGGARHAVPRTGDARRLRRALPGLRPRLLRLLRPEGDAQHRVARAAGWPRSAWTSAALQRVYRTFNADAEPFRKESERHGAIGRSRSITSPASRARARSSRRRATATGRRRPSCASSSRRASSRPSCAGAPSRRCPTSRRASAASARSPTR